MKYPLIQVENLSVGFAANSRPAVKNISFSVEKGQRLGIVGESGSGKTLTGLALIGLLPAKSISSGNIYLQQGNGPKLNIPGLQEKDLLKIRGNKIAMIFQEPMSSLNPAMKCGKQVEEILSEHTTLSRKEIKEETVRLFGEVKLPRPEEIYRSYPHQLSGGQRQRVMIAMAVACKPDLLIADEPTTALDVTVQKVILQLLKDLSEKYKISVIFISHDLGVIAELTEHLMVMYRGEIVERGLTSEVINNPAHDYTRGLLACRPPLEGRPLRLQTLASFSLGTEEVKKGNTTTKTAKKDDPEILLSVNGLWTNFALKRNLFGKATKELEAVKNVSFELCKGETLGLVGESGCGKTTLGRTIIQLIKSSSGDIIYKGIRVNDLKGDELRTFRRKLQIIFQDPYSSLNPGLTVGETIMEPMLVHRLYSSQRARREKAMELIEQVALEQEHFYRYPHQFSGGQRQRIGIARALALNPEMIICDESVSALDVSVQAQILNLLNDLKENFGLTYLFISHDLGVVRYMSDRMLVMQNGEIVESGSSDKIFLSPDNLYTKTLIEAIPKISID